jgi:hypothetical protein
VVLRHKGGFFIKLKYWCSYTPAKLDSRTPTCTVRIGRLLGRIPSSVEGSPTDTLLRSAAETCVSEDISLICDSTTVSQLKICDFSGEMCYTFLWVQRRNNCSPAVSFANCFMTLYQLKVHLQTFLSIPITQKCQILSCDTLVANERFVVFSTHRQNAASRNWPMWVLNRDK